MAKRRITADKLKRIEARTRCFVMCNRVMWMMFGLSVGMLVVAMATPQKQALDELEAALEDANRREQVVAEEKRDFEIELRALREDPEFLEIHARDRLDYFREGEQILKFRE